ncbi:MAG: hypothetical protein JNM56_07980 [Planctomycetia bacterium]|nr:hypothetical protein [Planctomycetia bacterium]
MSHEPAAPVVLELAPLPREQLGPFLLLGLPKDADCEQIEAHWAERVKAARKHQIRIPLEDVNWAREIINDPDRRCRAEASNLNLDLSDGTLARLAQTHGLTDQAAPPWKPYDEEKLLADYTPPTLLPELSELLHGLTLPEWPVELPAVEKLLQSYLPQNLDPWAVPLGEDVP